MWPDRTTLTRNKNTLKCLILSEYLSSNSTQLHICTNVTSEYGKLNMREREEISKIGQSRLRKIKSSGLITRPRILWESRFSDFMPQHIMLTYVSNKFKPHQ